MSEEKPKLGEILVKSGAISLRDLESFLQQQEELKDERGYQTKLGSLLLEHKLVNEETLALAFSIQQGVEYHDLQNYSPDLNLLERIPFSILSRFKFVPIFIDTNRLIIAIHDPIDTFLFDLLYKALGISIEFRSATRSGVDVCHSASLKSVQESGRMNTDFDVDFDEYRLIIQAESSTQSSTETKPEVSLDNTVNHFSFEEILRDTFRQSKVDSLQFRVLNEKVNIRTRNENKWAYYGTCSIEHFEAIYARAKSFTEFKDNEINYATQSFMEVPFGEDDYASFNVLFLPHEINKELIVEKFDIEPRNYCLHRLGVLPTEIQKIRAMNFKDRGALILGPAGMGKTVFLNALLSDENLIQNHYLYFSDHPTTKLDNASLIELDEERQQFQALNSVNMSSFDGVVLDGIHPTELGSCTRVAGNQTLFASLTANPIFPTLSAIEKQGDSLGFLLNRFNFIIYVKLVPSLCPYCVQPHRVSNDEITQFGLKPESFKKPFFYYAEGCDYCENRGFIDFSMIYEFLNLNPQVLKLLQENVVGNEMAMHLLKSGTLVPIKNIARDKLYKGEISLETYLQILQKKI